MKTKLKYLLLKNQRCTYFLFASIANLKTTLFFFFLLRKKVLKDFLWKSKMSCFFKFRWFVYVPNSCFEWLGCACLGLVSRAFTMFKFVICLYFWFLVTFEAIFYSNNIWNLTFRIIHTISCLYLSFIHSITYSPFWYEKTSRSW